MDFNFDHLPERRNSASFKWDKYPQEVLPLWVADMDFPSPPAVMRALHERVEHGIFGYPMTIDQNPAATMELRMTIIERLERLYRWKVEPDEIVLAPGVVNAFNMACQMQAAPNAGVLIEPPIYTPILEAPKNAGMQRQDCELVRQPDGSYRRDLERFEATITRDTALYILCNPHNPVGRVFRREELERVAEICLRRKLLICSDEIHCDLLYSGNHHLPVASLDPEIAHNTITLMAPSKTYNIAGLKCSYAIIQNPELRKRFVAAGKGLMGWINIMGYTAALAAYKEGEAWLQALLAYLEANRDYLHAAIQQELPELHMAKPEGTYLAWIDCRKASIQGSPYTFFLEKGKLAFNAGESYGSGGEGFVRLNFGCPRSVLVEAIERMKRALK